MNFGELKTFSHWNCDRKTTADRRELKGSILICLFYTQVEILHGDLNTEIERHLLLGRKVTSNLDSIFESRDITLPTKVRLVKAMVFSVVMHGCKSLIVKKAECRRIGAFEL